MKTLVSALVAVAALTGAASATQVESGLHGAIAHFNQDRKTSEHISVPGPDVVSISARAHSHEPVFAQFNAEADGQDDRRGTVGVTFVPGTPTLAVEIFERIGAESE
ncbi:hypothetical protein [Jannaschia seohaensis]|uniref:Uncharacterized protein n=1 Tax=Jannaschia seohaensis TaxID=475081 RepID=A0A2Y9AQ67_9RHOB|nr:hypothetical protein [Jannaschia seohaensis]PWJ18037.1 hypothetical protein BCF38_10524 [Jannaschia seohaensis]SSA46560.1 hypothetical protein SAMN05421539_10524 [Jannaschia seohaensis]